MALDLGASRKKHAKIVSGNFLFNDETNIHKIYTIAVIQVNEQQWIARARRVYNEPESSVRLNMILLRFSI